MLPVAKELRKIFLVCTLIVISVQFIGGPYVIYLWIPWAIFFFFARDFTREISPDPLAIVSPVDGKVIAIEQVTNPYLDTPACCYTIQQSSWGEFNLHSPVEGKIEQLWVTVPNCENKALALWVHTDEKDEVILQVELKSSTQHASTGLHPGERVGHGRHCGFAAIGCRVNVYLPENIKHSAEVGDKVTAAHSELGQLVHNK